jgi:alpha-L-fucosidase 2
LIQTLLFLVSALVAAGATPASPRLWYAQPAAAWNEAFPLGNGRLGAMVFADPSRERVQLNTTRAPELFAAARKVVETRLAHGGGGPGWSRAWMVNFFARLRDGEVAREHVLEFLRGSALPNLFCGPLFQVDGNFGATAGIAEMLLQSHERLPAGAGDDAFIIDLLPALPKSWGTGTVKGLTARGGLVVDLEWKDGRPVTVTVHSRDGGTCHLRWRDDLRTVDLRVGETRVLHPFSLKRSVSSRSPTR